MTNRVQRVLTHRVQRVVGEAKRQGEESLVLARSVSYGPTLVPAYAYLNSLTSTAALYSFGQSPIGIDCSTPSQYSWLRTPAIQSPLHGFGTTKLAYVPSHASTTVEARADLDAAQRLSPLIDSIRTTLRDNIPGRVAAGLPPFMLLALPLMEAALPFMLAMLASGLLWWQWLRFSGEILAFEAVFTLRGGDAGVYGVESDIYRGNAAIYGGDADIFGGSSDIFGGSSDIFGGSSDILGVAAENRWKKGRAMLPAMRLQVAPAAVFPTVRGTWQYSILKYSVFGSIFT
eukprot:299518-Rhodomonas_salina.4